MRIKLKYLIYISIITIFLLIIVFLIHQGTKSTISNYLKINENAPNFTFEFANGTTSNLYSFMDGKPTLLWFVVTWCSTCAYGNQVIADNIQFFNQHGIKILELEQYDDLGENGMNISQFIKDYGNPLYTYYGIASYNTTLEYNTPPDLQLDIYYLIKPDGKIVSIGTNLANNINSLENEINNLGL